MSRDMWDVTVLCSPTCTQHTRCCCLVEPICLCTALQTALPPSLPATAWTLKALSSLCCSSLGHTAHSELCRATSRKLLLQSCHLHHPQYKSQSEFKNICSTPSSFSCIQCAVLCLPKLLGEAIAEEGMDLLLTSAKSPHDLLLPTATG